MSDCSDHRLELVEQAINSHGAYLRAFLIGLTRNHHDGEELFDDLWIHVLNRFREEDINKLGLLRFKARQLFIDWWRKQQRNPVTAVEHVPEIAAKAVARDPFTEEEEDEFMERFFSEYPVDLSEGQKIALWAHAHHGLTFLEIGEFLNKPSSTVGDWVKQARILFAEAFNRH